MYTINGTYIKKTIEHYETECDIDNNSLHNNYHIVARNYDKELEMCGILYNLDRILCINLVNEKYITYKTNNSNYIDNTYTVNDFIIESDLNFISNTEIIPCIKLKLNEYFDELKSGTLIKSKDTIKKYFTGSNYSDITYFIIDAISDFGYINNLILTTNSKTITFLSSDPYDDSNQNIKEDKMFKYKSYKKSNLEDISKNYIENFENNIYHKTIINIGTGSNGNFEIMQDGKYKKIDIRNTSIENNNKYTNINNDDNIWKLLNDTPIDSCKKNIDYNGNRILKVFLEGNYLYLRVTDLDGIDIQWSESINFIIYCSQSQFDLVIETINGNGWKHHLKQNINSDIIENFPKSILNSPIPFSTPTPVENKMYVEIIKGSRIKFSLRDNAKFNLESFDFYHPIKCNHHCKPILVVTTDKSDNNFLLSNNLNIENTQEIEDKMHESDSKIYIDTNNIKIDQQTMKDFNLNIYNNKGKNITSVETKLKMDDVEIKPRWFNSNNSQLSFSEIYPSQFTLDVTARDEDNNTVHKKIPIYMNFSNTDKLPHILNEEIVINYNENTKVYLNIEINNENNDEIESINTRLLKDEVEYKPKWFTAKYKNLNFKKPIPEYNEFYNLSKFELEITVNTKNKRSRKKIIPLKMEFSNKEFIFDITDETLDAQFPNYMPYYQDLVNEILRKYQSLDSKTKLHINNKSQIFAPIENISLDEEKFKTYKEQLKQFNSTYGSKLIKKISELELNTNIIDQDPIKLILPINVNVDHELFRTFKLNDNLIKDPDFTKSKEYENLAKYIYTNYLNVKNKSKLHLDKSNNINAPVESLKINNDLKSVNDRIDTINYNENIRDVINKKNINSEIDEIKLLLPITFDK